MRMMVFLLTTLMSVSLSADESCHEEVKSVEADLPGDSLYNLSSRWMNQNGETVNLSKLQGQFRVVAMVYTKCQTACPLIVKVVQQTRAMMPQKEKLKVDFFSFDSETEDQNTLKKFVEKYKLDNSWSVYKSTAGSVAELAAALGVQYKKLPSGEYIHSNIFFVVNEKGQIIAKHEGLTKPKKEFIDKLLKTPNFN